MDADTVLSSEAVAVVSVEFSRCTIWWAWGKMCRQNSCSRPDRAHTNASTLPVI